jgi:HEAT repeat protein
MTEIERLIVLLYSADAREAGARLAALGAAAVEPLIAILNRQYLAPDLSQLNTIGAIGSAPDVTAARERAAYVLGDIGDPRAVDTLLAAYAGETDRHIRLAAALALGKIGDPRAVDTLLAALDAPIWTPDDARIVDDLVRMAGSRAVEPLIRLVRRRGYTYGAAARAVTALLAFRTDPRVLDGLIAALRLDAEIATVQALIAALAELRDPRGAQALVALIRTMMQLPVERWGEREENLSETEQGVVFHVLKSHFRAAVAAVRKIGGVQTLAALEDALRGAPSHIPPD